MEQNEQERWLPGMEPVTDEELLAVAEGLLRQNFDAYEVLAQ